MDSGQPTASVIAIGSAIALYALLSPNPPYGLPVWLGFASVYLLVGILLGYPQYAHEGENISLRYASLVAVVSALCVASIHVGTWALADPELTLHQLSRALWLPHVLIPAVAACMAPLGVAENRRQRLGIGAVVLMPLLVTTLRTLPFGISFSPLFTVVYVGVFPLSGVAVGFPLYLYGRALR